MLGPLLAFGLISLALRWSTPPQKTENPYQKPYRFSTDWFTSRIPVWEEALRPLKGQPQLHYLEIGVFEGRSALWMLENVLTHPASRMTCIDTFPGQLEDRFRANLALSGMAEKVTVLKGYSQEILKSLPPGSFDLIYIDGSHVAKDVLTDAVLSWQLLKTGGMLIFDDYRWARRRLPPEERPQVAIDSFLRVYRREYDLIHKKHQVILKKTRT